MHYVSFSGGTDSTATALLLIDQGVDFELIFADTGAELPETQWFIPRFARQIGKPLRVLSGGTFFQHLANYGFLLPAPRLRWCTRLLKEAPMDRFYTAEDTVYVGIRGDESHRAHNKTKKKSKTLYPLVQAGMGKDDVLKLCEKHGALNPIYKWRSNCSCFCCFFQRNMDWKGLWNNHPDLFSLAEEWEELSILTTEKRYTWRRGKRLRRLRESEENQLKLWPEEEESPCLICQI